MGLLNDKSGKPSSSRVYEALIVLTVIGISWMSVFTNKDIGQNIGNVLIFVIPIAIGAFEYKKSKETK